MILGVVGKFSSGKDAVADYLRGKGWTTFSLSQMIRDEHVRRYNTPAPDREAQIQLGDLLREEKGENALALMAKEKILEENLDNVCIISIRAPGEAEELLTLPNFTLLALDADQRLRYERGKARGNERDSIAYEQFKEQEYRESNAIGTKMHHNRVMAMAHLTIINEGTKQELYKQIDDLLVTRQRLYTAHKL